MHTYDVIILGSGAAGMMAGITLANAGLKCLMLEKGKSIASCNAAKAGGPALAGTKTQAAEGYPLTPEQLYQHMFRFSRGTVNAALLRNIIAQGADVEDVFLRNGIGMKLLPDTYGVGFRARHFYDCFGEKRWQPLADDFTSHGGTILLQREAISLLTENGKVAGVKATDLDTGSEETYYGAHVIVATGGYLGSEEKKHQHFGNIHVVPLGNKASDGKGIDMVVAAGGTEDRNWGICANEFGGANHKLLAQNRPFSSNLRFAVTGGLLVDRDGRRFMNEQYQSDEPLSIGGEHTARAGVFYAVMDETMYQGMQEMTPYAFYGSPEDWFTGKNTLNQMPRFQKPDDLEKDIAAGAAIKADTLEEAAEGFGLTDLVESVKAYNALCKAGLDSQFGKAAYLLIPIEKAPFYLFEYEPSAWCTFGGVKTNAFCQALDADQQVISGLYVAGVDNGSCFCTPYYDNEGAALGTSFCSGILAAKHILGKV